MGHRVGILMGGYGFIAMTYLWVWGISAAMAPRMTAERMECPGRADMKTMAFLGAVWTVAWVLLSAFNAWD